ncbi:uncharacterized protein LOC120508532 isoform X1 [Passer montanus]|uniref:uncharacterized protein LOC120508532 isoform X1 n=1 Tax=Passer montanus TaxID=9160 RepID=UPI00196142CD|nr:uncharacterized protein LOC120508532 isoform X1 [Passer montanus]
MEDQRVPPPQLLERQVAVVATLGEVVAAVTASHRGVRRRVSPVFLHAALGRFTQSLCETLEHGDVTSLGYCGVPSLGRALAALEATPEARDSAIAAVVAWQKMVDALGGRWGQLAWEAAELCAECKHAAPARAGDPRDEATHRGTAWGKLVAAVRWPTVDWDEEEEQEEEEATSVGATRDAWEAAATSEEELTTNEEELATKEEEAAMSEEEVVTNEEDVATNEEEAAMSEEEVATNKEEVATSKEEVAMSEEEVATNKEEVAMSEEEVTTNEEEVAIDKEEAAMSEEEVATNKEQVAISEEEVAPNKEDVATNEEEAAMSEEEVTTNKEDVTTNKEEVAIDKEEAAMSEEEVATSEAMGEAVVAASQARVAARRGRLAEAALGPLERLVAACDDAMAFTRNMEFYLWEINVALKFGDRASRRVLEALVAEFQQLWDASARLFREYLLETLELIDKLLLSPHGGPGGPSGPISRAVDERCRDAIRNIPRLLWGQ